MTIDLLHAPANLTPIQRVVLAYYDAENTGAFRFEGRWVSENDIRSDPRLAERFYDEKLS